MNQIHVGDIDLNPVNNQNKCMVYFMFLMHKSKCTHYLRIIKPIKCVCAWLRSSNTPPGCLRIPDPLTLTSESTLHSSLRQLSAAENSRDILLVVRARRDRFRSAHKVEESVI